MTERARSDCWAIDTPDLRMRWSEAPWDTRTFGFPVWQIHQMEIYGVTAFESFAVFNRQRSELGAGLVSCRLPERQLRESMLLECNGFHFVEMVYQPAFELDDWQPGAQQSALQVLPADPASRTAAERIATTAFVNERFHVDPRIDRDRANERYRRWVAGTVDSVAQQLWTVHSGTAVVAFFVTELQADGTCYWHLNAVAPEAQGRGLGYEAWRVMMLHARNSGATRIRTCIVARNERVLNLYARLGFRFDRPQMTFHWMPDPSA